MAEITTIARPYAEAIFKLALADGTLAQWNDRLREMGSVAANSDMHGAIGNPKIDDHALGDLFLSLIKTPQDEAGKNFIRLLIDNGRMDALPQIALQFSQLKDDHENVAEADVASAFPLSDDELAAMMATLEKRFKRKIKPTVRIDRELIGGVRVAIGDEVLDASVRGQLQAMATTLQS